MNTYFLILKHLILFFDEVIRKQHKIAMIGI